jgi:hypothetical protein
MGRCNPRWFFHINTLVRHGTSNHKPPMHLGFHLQHCCATKATSSRLSTCIYNRDNRSLKPSALAILHRERANKVFGNWSSLLFNLLHQALHHSSSTSSSIACRVSSHLPRTLSLSGRSLGIYSCWGSDVRTQLLNHVLHIEHVDLRRHNFAR